MLDQLDDLRPPTFTFEHLHEMQRRARKMRRQRRRNRGRAAAMIAAATLLVVFYVAPRGHSSGLNVSTVTGTPGPTRPTSVNSTGSAVAATPGWPPTGAGSEIIMPTADSSGFIIVNLANHTSNTIPLPANAQINGQALIPRSGGLAGYSGTSAYVWPTSLNGPGRDLGPANRLFPAVTDNQIWTMAQVSGPTPTDPVGSETVREVNTDGATTAGPFTVPALTTPIGAVNGGLVLQTYEEYKPNTSNALIGLTLWNPNNGTSKQVQAPAPIGDVVASGNVIGWTISDSSSGTVAGQIDLLNLATNQLNVIQMGAGSSTAALNLASVAPDGTHVLAIGGPIADQGPVGDTPPADYRDNAHVWVLDAATGTARDIGQISDPDAAAWSPNSQWIWDGLDGHLTAQAIDGHAAYSLPVPAPGTQNGTELTVR